MQIEQVIGGVNGDTSAQAIQLRMRSNAQNQVSNARLLAWDAAGENPIVLIDFSTDVSNGTAGSRVLAATAAFSAYTDPPVDADFILTAPIPQEYLTAGSLTLENDEGTLLVWRLSWGGSGYTGSTTGALTNDDDREFGPPLASALPNSGLAALLFQGAATATSTSNAADYELTDGAAVFTNNAGQSFTVVPLPCPNDPDNDIDHDGVCGDVDNCPLNFNHDQADADDDGSGNVCDGCPQDPNKIIAGACGCGTADTDSDADGVANCEDNCSQQDNEDQANSDGDVAGDACDGCPQDADKVAPGVFGCGVPETDSDGDGVPDADDNCAQEANLEQADQDEDGVGDACDGCPNNPDISDSNASDCDDDVPPDPDGDGTDGDPDNDGDSNGGGGATGPRPRACGVGMLFIAPLLFLGLFLCIVRDRARRSGTKL